MRMTANSKAAGLAGCRRPVEAEARQLRNWHAFNGIFIPQHGEARRRRDELVERG